MTKENLDKGYDILYNIKRIEEIIKFIDDKHSFISLIRPGTENFSFFNISRLISDIMDVNVFQEDIFDNLKMSCRMKIEKLKAEFESL
jgi:hypothetical protein